MKGSSFEQFLVLKKKNVFYLLLFYSFSYFESTILEILNTFPIQMYGAHTNA